MKRRLAVVLVVAVAAIAGTAGSATATKSGELHLTKECSKYDGTVGSHCTITSSNTLAIRPGMRVVYLQAPADGVLDADILLTSQRGAAASGHVVLDLTTALGSVTLSGRTGNGASFSADAVVSLDADGVWHWDGTFTIT